ncbi:MAG: septal ring lytic transglycosylase RlpA family protein [Hyphomicrobiaceae bacterium]|nr:MAG: septal ring lytic transglycosylase RlpA family protein [Hyphomicrobiaceae bacterium]
MRLPLLPRAALGLAVAAVAVSAGACSRTDRGGAARLDRNHGVAASARVIADGQPIPKGGGRYKLGDPYQIDGQWYVPREDPAYDRRGVASYYAADFHGRRTANGEIFDMWALTAAHPTLPLPCYVYVTNLENGRTLLLRVNDRGPYVNNRMIDVSRAAARYLGFEARGLASVRVRYAGQAPLSGDDRFEQRFLANQPWFRVALAIDPLAGRMRPR